MGKLKELEDWMSNVLNSGVDGPMRCSVYLSGRCNKRVLHQVKTNSAKDCLPLECIKYRAPFDAYPSDVSIKKFNDWLEKYPDFKQRWDTVEAFLDEIKKYGPAENINDYIGQVIEYIDSYDKIHLHKPNAHYGDPFGMLKINIDESFFVLSHGEQERKLMMSMPLCLGVHNNRAIFAIDEYVVGCSCSTMAEKFTVMRKRKKCLVECPLTVNEQEKIEELVFKFAHYIEMMLIRKDKYPRVIIFEASRDNVLNENISTKIRNLWDDELQGIDVRTNTSLTDSYMTMLGYLFSPVNKADRACMSFYSTASGFGKTAFVRALCKRTDVVFRELAADAKANQFTFSYAIADGPDILQADDPMKHTEDILNKVSNLVSNHTSQCELKGGAVKTVENLFTKILITSNIPLYIKSDQNNFLTEKLFELRTNEMPSCTNNPRVAEIVHYIETASDNEINSFLTKCINMYNDNPDWLKQHKGQYVEQDEIACKFALIDPAKLKDTHNKTLLACKYNNVYGYDVMRHSAYSDIQTQWNVMCKYIKTTWPRLADTCKCAVPRESGIYAPTSVLPSNRFKNYTLNDELRAKIRECISEFTFEDTSVTDADTCGVRTYGCSFEELFDTGKHEFDE